MSKTCNDALPFGTVLGYAPGNIPAYSSDYHSVDANLIPDRHAFRHYVNGIYTGYKWQCVEFARRWLLLNKGYVFDDIAMAYDIFRLKHVREINSGRVLPLYAFENGAQRAPELGSMLIWAEGGEFEHTGHVAIVTEVLHDRVRVAEQNLHHQLWANGCNYSRELPATRADDGSFWIQCSFADASILGWVTQTNDATHAVDSPPLNPRLLQLQLRQLHNKKPAKSWLNIANPDEAAYVQANGYRLASTDADQDKYLVISESAIAELKRATNELHALFLHATDYVLQHDYLLEKFNIPAVIWPRIHQSWDNRRNQAISGRFDFCVTEAGLKVYEYNADSASCHMECGKVQGMWAKHFQCRDGRDPGDDLFDDLVDAWHDNAVEGLIHIMLDQDQEENYHALFMQSTMQKAGIPCKIIQGVQGLHWAENGDVLDADGIPIHWVWKTWAWETALDQLREELDSTDSKRSLPINVDIPPKLMDVLFRPQTMVIEPLWTLITSNKAILPILWDMFPDHPYLLESQFELTNNLREQGYVSKPIAGRCGLNISLVDHQSGTIDETAGRFGEQTYIYQQLCKLPEIGGHYVQVSSFLAGGNYAGACVRVDRSPIITNGSDILPLRVVRDDDLMG